MTAQNFTHFLKLSRIWSRTVGPCYYKLFMSCLDECLKADIPGSLLNILERAKGDKNGDDGFATAKLLNITRKLCGLENFLKMELRFVLNF